MDTNSKLDCWLCGAKWRVEPVKIYCKGDPKDFNIIHLCEHCRLGELTIEPVEEKVSGLG